ncbi:hypothetical protein RAZWK3B_16795 [Roseobacter sp. AzwK-3b]|uniref:hypothetical protein n=1 Tax=Roseobacter sp. AzwK-3b TaxID=351016 RepID=UPI00015699C1|nr:hypothetical protein [Roseobacter sp. AzwK-3b]EDM71074.1 hypothetical protein RAZWK3B_16795 [Roseobacter sp. AzwK-3b]
MTKHPRLQPIPDARDPHLEGLAKHTIDYAMAEAALRDLPFDMALHVFEAVIEARPDVDADALEHLANRLGRRAHMEARHNA